MTPVEKVFTWYTWTFYILNSSVVWWLFLKIFNLQFLTLIYIYIYIYIYTYKKYTDF